MKIILDVAETKTLEVVDRPGGAFSAVVSRSSFAKFDVVNDGNHTTTEQKTRARQAGSQSVVNRPSTSDTTRRRRRRRRES